MGGGAGGSGGSAEVGALTIGIRIVFVAWTDTLIIFFCAVSEAAGEGLLSDVVDVITGSIVPVLVSGVDIMLAVAEVFAGSAAFCF